jgi:peptide-methionine (S)-S-oxide reductase
VGYAGGTTENPTYYKIGDHNECVQVDFDPQVVSYEQLLAAFWSGHGTSYPSADRQYRSAILYNSPGQKKAAIDSMQKEQSKGGPVYTDIEELVHFYVAEDYHQKYYLRETPAIMREISAIYPDPAAFRDSTAAARLNGLLAGYGDQATLEKQIGRLGLSEAGKTALLKEVSGGLRPGCPVIIPGRDK